MQKLKLSLDDLAVDSFATHDPQAHPGTVRGNAGEETEEAAAITGWSWLCGTCKGSTCESTCNEDITCVNSCGGDKHTLCNNTYCQTQTTTFNGS